MNVSEKYKDLQIDIEKYLESKIPGIPYHVVVEISTVVASKAVILTNEIIQHRDEQWQKTIKDIRKEWEERNNA